jgi:signal transduction histidine kinase
MISDLPISEVSYKIAKEVCDNFQIDRCIIHDYRNSQTNFVTEYDRIESIPLFQGIHNDDNIRLLTKYINFQNQFCKKFIQNIDESFVCAIDNVKNDSNFNAISKITSKFNIGAMICVTTLFNKKINGGIYLHQSQPRNWLADEIEAMEIIADQISIAFDRSVSIEKVMIGNHALMEKTMELKQALKKEQEMRRMQNEFVALVSHEFKTPLQIIDGTREVLHRKILKTTNDPTTIKYLSRIKVGIERMNGLITSTLNLAKMESGQGKISLEIEQINLKEFITDIINKNINLAENKKIKIITKIDSLPLSFRADPKLLNHSFNNILSNAIKYSKNDSIIKVIAKSNSKYVALKFIDKGIGIPKSDIKNIGKKFYRAKNTLSVAGTGIGLYLSQHFIELHSGKLYIDSEINIGTSVTVILPI